MILALSKNLGVFFKWEDPIHHSEVTWHVIQACNIVLSMREVSKTVAKGEAPWSGE